jgi:pimeloyl-ACP methyl ester carboxylesterase
VLKSLRYFFIPIAAVAVTGCAPLASVSVRAPRFAVAGPAAPQLQAAARQAARDPLAALATELSTARKAAETLRRDPSDVTARDIYNFAVARSIETIERADLDAWNRPLAVPGADGGFVVTTRRKPGPDHDPANYTLVAADRMGVGGAYFRKRVVVPGVGAPFVAIRRGEIEDHRSRFIPQRLYAGVTAVIRFDGRRAEIEFLDPLSSAQVTLSGHSYPLAADFSAAMAKNLAVERPDRLGLIRLLRPDRFADTAQLVRLQPYDPNRIPVVFVHGLQDTPATWTPMINALRQDPEIRRRYQFWVFSYPSGHPYPFSAALMRQDLNDAHRAFPGHKPIILVGHSMGGLVSRLMVTDSGDRIWREYFSKPSSQMVMHRRSGKMLKETLVFDHLPFVSRVVFIAAPHRGSGLASNWIGRTASRLVRAPALLADLKDALVAVVTVDPSAVQFDTIPNSVDTLSPNPDHARHSLPQHHRRPRSRQYAELQRRHRALLEFAPPRREVRAHRAVRSRRPPESAGHRRGAAHPHRAPLITARPSRDSSGRAGRARRDR